ncbi:MAG: LacI family DNA-binding transcriptional regulator [Bacteroidia bacterium]|nr:LacI family DNA-binding transcriptional regulator [Bacteroidia bacterium]
MLKRQVTLADIGKELGVSTATVSRALKDYPDISKETKQKVLDLVKKWNYRPNSMAAGLRKRESKVIGVIIPEIINHFFSSVIKGIMKVAYEADYRVMLCQSDESYEKEVADANALFSSRVDGIMASLAHGTKNIDHFLAFKDVGIPVVFFDKVPSNTPDVSKVVVDDYKGAFRVVEHLIQQGYRRIAHFRGPMLASTSINRYNGYKDALSKYNLAYDPNLVFTCENITLEEGRAFAKRCLENGNFDAIFCITDQVAIGAMLEIKEAGKSVPEDIAIAGFSNWTMSSIVEPKLTTVAQPGLEMGKRAMQLLLDEIRSNKEEVETEAQTVTLETELLIRSSSSKSEVLV